jgi:hypothetical protein
MADAPLENRVDKLEWRQETIYERSLDHGKRIDVIEKNDVAIAIEVKDVANELKGVRASVDKLVWFIVGLSLTIATSSVGLAIQQILSHNGGTP